MLMVATIIVKLVITTATSHHLPNHSNNKVVKQVLAANQHATQDLMVALIQSHQVAEKIIKAANQLFSSN